MKTPVLVSKDYTVYFEDYQGLTVIHCDCHRWNKTVKKKLKEDFNCLVRIHGRPIYAIHEIDDRKHLKFISYFGFRFHNSFVGSDDTSRHLFIRTQNGN